MPCSVLDCGRPRAAQGYCDTHYRRLRRYGNLDAPPRPKRGECSVKKCGRQHYGGGLCQRHWQAKRLHGDPLLVADTGGRKRRAKDDCDVDGCVQPYRVRGFCDKHYRRWKQHGDPLVVIDPNAGIPWLTKGAYRILRMPRHPLARASGHVLEHRMVLFDSIGSGTHACHWCAMVTTWSNSWPKSADALVVDHLDRDRTNNVPGNLVPSCQPCNAKRANEWRGAVKALRQ